MSRNIRNTIQEVIVDKIVEEGDESRTARRMQELALSAIIKGQRDSQGKITNEWRDYMTFLLTGLAGRAANPDDLRRLLPEEDDGPAATERQKDRAYLLANGMCGTGTGRNILVNGGRTRALDEDQQ
jgi:hypothetical protein